jgi:hypothetical protein
VIKRATNCAFQSYITVGQEDYKNSLHTLQGVHMAFLSTLQEVKAQGVRRGGLKGENKEGEGDGLRMRECTSMIQSVIFKNQIRQYLISNIFKLAEEPFLFF